MSKCKYEYKPEVEEYLEMAFDCKEQSIENGKFCVFHDEVHYAEHEHEAAHRFEELLKESINQNKPLECMGYYLPAINFAELLEGKSFVQPVSFNEATFYKEANFSTATFSKEAYFSEAKFTEGADFGGAAFSERANFSNATFTEGADFMGAAFSERANFFKATFTEGANFSAARFHEGADFMGAAFTKKANFSEATFSKEAYFSEAKFTEGANFWRAAFYGMAYFSNATFTEGANFGGAAFYGMARFSWAAFSKEADFMGAAFTKKANFEEATFSKEADFSTTTFTEGADFGGAAFSERANFSRGAFSKETIFSEAKFLAETYFLSNTFDDKTLFKYAIFGQPNKVIFDDSDLSNVSFAGSDITTIRFGDKIKWRRVKNDVTIIEEEWLKYKVKGKNTLGYQDEYQDVSLDLVLSAYRNLRENFEFRLKFDESGKLFIREMELKRNYRYASSKYELKLISLQRKLKGDKSPLPNVGELIENGWFRKHLSLTGLYYHLSRYGESISRPAAIGAITVFLSTLFWLTQSNPTLEPHFYPSAEPDITSSFIGFAQLGNGTQWLKAFERSFADFLPLLSLGGDIKVGVIDYIIKIVGGALTFGLLLIAFRRKFERKYTR